MKTFSARKLLSAAGTIALSLGAAPMHAATPEEEAVLAPVHALFDGMAKHDGDAIKASALATASLTSMRDGKPTLGTFAAFAEHMGKVGNTPIEERIHDPLVRIDHDLAVVWAPFDFFLDGKLHHCGTDLFNLVRVDEKWLIASASDTERKDCAAK